MCVRRLAKGILVCNSNAKFPGCDPAEEIGRAPAQFLIARDVMAQRRPREEERAAGGKRLRIVGSTGPLD